MVVKNEDIKGGYWNQTSGISKHFNLFNFNQAHPTPTADRSSTSDINQQHEGQKVTIVSKK